MNCVWAIVVVYNRIGNLRNLLETISPQVKEILVIDNGSKKSIVAELKDLVCLFPTVQLHENKQNIGLAAAQNQAIKSALNRTDITHILFLDDDSLPADDMVEKLLRSQQEYEEQTGNGVGIIAPNPKPDVDNRNFFYVLRGGFLGYRKAPKLHSDSDIVYSVIASGSLIPMETFKICGYFKSNYFIDCIDTEFSFRVYQHGLKILLVPEAKLTHSIGEITSKSIFHKKVDVWNHSPIRKYYIIRNRIWLWREYFFKEFPYVLFEMKHSITFVVKTVLFEKQRLKKIREIIRGIVDGICKDYR